MPRFEYRFREEDRVASFLESPTAFRVVKRPPEEFEEYRDDRVAKVGMFIAHFWVEHRFGPTMREIQQATDIQSLSTVKEAVDTLRDSKYVTYVPKQARTLVPTDKLLEQV
tara:strand:+ start:6753 stop:7085 length:333 start_codon:yes stop_codon:yes gene_type:complete